jgi:hypothetical protein
LLYALVAKQEWNQDRPGQNARRRLREGDVDWVVSAGSDVLVGEMKCHVGVLKNLMNGVCGRGHAPRTLMGLPESTKVA